MSEGSRQGSWDDRVSFTKLLYGLLILDPVVLVLNFALHADATLVFLASGLALVSLAALVGQATEQLAIYTGPRIGALIQSTLGNAAELTITIVAIRAGLLAVVKASITGSILGNSLLVLGRGLFFGGLEHSEQRYDRGLAGTSSTMMTLALAGLLIAVYACCVLRGGGGLRRRAEAAACGDATAGRGGRDGGVKPQPRHWDPGSGDAGDCGDERGAGRIDRGDGAHPGAHRGVPGRDGRVADRQCRGESDRRCRCWPFTPSSGIAFFLIAREGVTTVSGDAMAGLNREGVKTANGDAVQSVSLGALRGSAMTAGIEAILREVGALQEGHFLLSSGRHSDRYIEKFALLMRPRETDGLPPDRGAVRGGGHRHGGGADDGRHLAGVRGRAAVGVRAVYAGRVEGGSGREFRRGANSDPGSGCW